MSFRAKVESNVEARAFRTAQEGRAAQDRRRRGALLWSAALLAGACVVVLVLGVRWNDPAVAQSEEEAEKPVKRPPHVVLYVIDTLRADRLGFMGYAKRPTSPFLDQLAKESVVFEQAHSVAPWTLPSATSLLTSTFPCEHQVLAAGRTLSPQIPTIAQRLRKLGYATGAFYANVWLGTSGLNRDYEFFRDVNAIQGAVTDFWAGAVNDRPFFLYIHSMEPHDPYALFEPFAPTTRPGMPQPAYRKEFEKQPPDVVKEYKKLILDYIALTRRDFDRKQPLGTTDNSAEQLAILGKLAGMRDRIDVMYDASVRAADENLAGVVQKLNSKQIKSGEVQWDNTLFIVTSDHGEELGDRDSWGHDQSVYQELIHVPLMIRFPGGQHGGTRVGDVVSLLDVMPTILDFVGRADLARLCRGKSLLPRIRGENATANTTGVDATVIPSMRHNLQKYAKRYREARGDRNVVVREGDWKAIWNADLDSVELYDLSKDPAEMKNVASAEPERAASMKKKAEEWHRQCTEQGAALPPPDVERLDPHTRKQLEQLGYVGKEE